MFKVTPDAAAQIKHAAEQSGMESMVLRLAAKTKDDGSIDYRMGFDQESEMDISYKSEGVTIVMAPEYVPLLDTTTMDYVELEEGEDKQFIFLNPLDPNYVPPSE